MTGEPEIGFQARPNGVLMRRVVVPASHHRKQVGGSYSQANGVGEDSDECVTFIGVSNLSTNRKL